MNVVDTSLWLEYLADAAFVHPVSAVIENTKSLIVPSVVIYEVFKKLLLIKSKREALSTIANMKKGRMVNWNMSLSFLAAEYSIEHHLAMADAVIYATARRYNGVLWTQDAHFKNLAAVHYFEKIR